MLIRFFEIQSIDEISMGEEKLIYSSHSNTVPQIDSMVFFETNSYYVAQLSYSYDESDAYNEPMVDVFIIPQSNCKCYSRGV